MKEKSSFAGLKNLTYCSCSAIDLSSNGIGRFILSAEESGEPSQTKESVTGRLRFSGPPGGYFFVLNHRVQPRKTWEFLGIAWERASCATDSY